MSIRNNDRLLTAEQAAAARWKKGDRIVRPILYFRHECNPPLGDGEPGGLVFLDDMSVFWNYRTIDSIQLLDAGGDWLCRVAIFASSLFVEASYCEAQCDDTSRDRLRRLATSMLAQAKEVRR